MADIQSAAAEIRRGKKIKNKPQHENIYGLPYYIGQTIKKAAKYICWSQKSNWTLPTSAD